MNGKRGHRFVSILAPLVLWALASPAPAGCTLAGRHPDNLDFSERLHVIRTLESVFPESQGFRVNAPMKPVAGTPQNFARLVEAYRVIVPDDVTVTQAAHRFTSRSSPFIPYVEAKQESEFRPVLPVGYGGVPVTAVLDGKVVDVQFLTVNMQRWLIWARTCYFPVLKGDRDTPMQEYAAEVSQYLRRTDFGETELPELDPSDFGAPARSDLFGGSKPLHPDLAEYVDYTSSCREIDVGPVRGVLNFTAGRGAIEWFVDHCGNSFYRDRNQGDLQRVFYTFTIEGREFAELRSLTPEVLATLEPGRYFFAVDEYGRVRFGPMKLAPDAPQQSLWAERMKSYECLLFPGQPLRAAGEFVVAAGEPPMAADLEGAPAAPRRIAAVNAFSAYYFYRPDDKNLERRIEKKSDEYLRSVGHFFRALEGMGIEAEGVMVSKF